MGGVVVDDLIRQYTEAWASRDPAKIVALHTDDTTFHAHTGQDAARGKAAVRQAFADLLERFPDLAFAAVSLRTGDDFWVAEWQVSGTPPGTDTRVEVDLVDVVTVEGGLVKTKDSYIDAVTLQAQLGLVAAQ
jgi:steroid delta-isomerase-like uncharacterized protein